MTKALVDLTKGVMLLGWLILLVVCFFALSAEDFPAESKPFVVGAFLTVTVMMGGFLVLFSIHDGVWRMVKALESAKTSTARLDQYQRAAHQGDTWTPPKDGTPGQNRTIYDFTDAELALFSKEHAATVRSALESGRQAEIKRLSTAILAKFGKVTPNHFDAERFLSIFCVRLVEYRDRVPDGTGS